MTKPSAGRSLALILMILAVTVGLLGAYWWFHSRFIQSTDNAYVEAEMSVIAPRVAGYVAEVLVENNTQVRAGDALLRLVADDYQARERRAGAQLQARTAALDTLATQVQLQKALIKEAEAGVASAKAELARARSDSKRYAELVDDRAASRQQLESAVAAFQQAESAVNAASAALSARTSEMAVLTARRSEIEAQLSEAEAALTLAQIDLSNTVVRAPMDGVVGNRHVQVGQYLQPGSAVLNLVPLQAVYVTANFKETQVENMAPGQVVDLEIDAYPDTPIQGVVESFSPAAGSRFSLLPPENATGNFTKIVQRIPVRIRIGADSPLAGMLRPGMSVIASVDTRSAQPNDEAPVAPRVAGAGPWPL
ncbi:HlyD family secretion protein [Parahaliea mediterranea]|uniref:HlyD family secretion protein n=1 Tax=Parahaliea mediterranea TaxID=651086 RepID=UPI0019D486F0|nr:HlyD family secretion protein [Parahaliea mediterranea]